MRDKTRRLGAALACASLVALGSPSASAALIVTTIGSAGTAVIADGVFPSFNPPFGPTRFETLIASKSFTDVGTLTHSVIVPTQSDVHFIPNGIRWVETVTNNSGVSWSGFTFALNPDPALPLFFPDSPDNVPSFVTLTGSGAGVTNVALQGPVLRSGRTISQNAADTLISVDFSSDLLDPSESFSVYFALINAPINQPFSLTESPIRLSVSIPEPATLALLVLALAGLAFARRYGSPASAKPGSKR